MLKEIVRNIFFLRGWASFESLSCNVYALRDERSGEFLLIDAGSGERARDVEALKKLAPKLKSILCTHGHYDHVSGVAALGAPRAQTSLAFLSEKDFSLVEDEALFKPLRFSRMEFGEFSLRVIPTPGHTFGSVCFLEEVNKILFSGDTLFAGGVHGRTDLGGDEREMRESLARLKRLRFELLCPGHDEIEFK